jgi:RNA polymerase sigma factor (sigma-70 family)
MRAGDLMATPKELLVCIRLVATAADHEAFARLFKHFAPRIKGFLMRSGMAAELAEELAQEAMVTVWRKATLFDPSRGSLSTWIFTIARNLRISHHRRLPGGTQIDVDEAGDDQQPADCRATPEDSVTTLQREERLQAALSGLSPEQALVLRLSFFEEQPHLRIAEELDIPLGTVKSRIRRAVLQLRRALEGRIS